MGDESLSWVVKYPVVSTAMKKLIEYVTNDLYICVPTQLCSALNDYGGISASISTGSNV